MQHCLVAETQGVLSHCKMGVIGLTQWRVLIIQHFVRLKIHSCHDLTLQDQCSTQHYTNAAQSTAESCSSCSASWSKLSILNNWNQPIVQTALPIILPTAHCRPQNRSTQARTNAKCLQYTGNECITSDSSMLIHGLSLPLSTLWHTWHTNKLAEGEKHWQSTSGNQVLDRVLSRKLISLWYSSLILSSRSSSSWNTQLDAWCINDTGCASKMHKVVTLRPVWQDVEGWYKRQYSASDLPSGLVRQRLVYHNWLLSLKKWLRLSLKSQEHWPVVPEKSQHIVEDIYLI